MEGGVLRHECVGGASSSHRGGRDGARAPFSSKNHTETFSDSHAHGIFGGGGLFLGTFNNLWLMAWSAKATATASFLAPSLTDRRSAPRCNPGLSGSSHGRSRCLQLGARWHRKRGPLRFLPQFPPRGPAPPARRRPLTRMALSCSVTRLCFLRPNRLPMAAPRRQAEPVAAAPRPPYSARPTAAARRHAPQNAKQLRP